jgi:hypothetical protein
MAKDATHPPLFGELQTLEVKNLIGWGYLTQHGCKSGTFTWRIDGNVTAQVGGMVWYSPDEVYLQLSYRYKGETRTYRIPVEPQTGNLGKGVIWFFRCPNTCHRCRKLYLYDGWFVHRKAVPGMYVAQTYSKRWRREKRVYDAVFDRAELEAELYKPNAKQVYRGKPTRRSTRFESKLIKAETIATNGLHLIFR